MRNEIFEHWNSTQTYPNDPCIHQRFEYQAARAPHAIAVEHAGQRLSYRELDERANQLAHVLLRAGVAADERVAIRLPRGPHMIVSILAVLKAGGAFVPLDPKYPRERTRSLLEDIAPRVLLTESDIHDGLDTAAQVEVVELDRSAWRSESTIFRNSAPKPGDLAYMIYTSGSTGQPKGVMIEHRALNSQISALLHHYAIGAHDRLLQFVAPTFDVSLEEIFSALLSGATLVLRTDAWITSPEDFCKLCESHAISVANVPTLFWHQLAHAVDTPFPACLRLMIIGGEAVSAAGLERWWSRAGHLPVLCNAYGPTETTINATISDCTPDTPVRSIGRPLPDVRVYILDEHAQPAPVGVVGEIYIGGDQVARGYWKRPELTAARFVPDPFAGLPGARMYKTGDQARWLEGGLIEFRGRDDHQVKIRGYRIELGEIEAALGSCEGVSQALVLAREDQPGDKRLVGYVLAREAATALSADSLRSQLRATLPEYMVPSAFVMLESFPLTSHGKLDRRALPAPARQAYVSRDYQAPRGELEQGLASIWQELLRMERIGRHDNFFEIGGHSLLGMKLITRVRETFDVRSASMTIFRYPTIEDMAQQIERMRSEAPTALIPMSPLTARPASACAPMAQPQEWWWNLTQVDKNRSTRNLSTAVRVSGPLQVEALQHCFAELYRRHEALRTRIVDRQQLVEAAGHYELPVITLGEATLGEREAAAAFVFAQVCDELLDVASDALFAARLLKLDEDDHVLIIALDHLIADASSMLVILRDVWTMYAQLEAGRPLGLSTQPLQSADYAVWQQQNRAVWLANHGSFWEEQLRGAERIRLFSAEEASHDSHRGFSAAPFDFGAATTTGLRELSRRERTTLAMTVLTAWVALVARKCNTEDVVVPFLSVGRPGPEVEHTVGCFASPLYLRFPVQAEDTFLELLERVTTVYGAAFERDDLGHIGSLVPRPECTYNSCFNWHPKEFHLDPVTFLISIDSSEIEGMSDALTLRAFDVPEPSAAESDDMVWDDEPGLFLVETPDTVAGLLLYRVERVAASAAESLAQRFVRVAESMVAAPHARVSD